MFAVDLLVRKFLRQGLRGLHGFLGLDGKSI
jgi:hypothetical protein